MGETKPGRRVPAGRAGRVLVGGLAAIALGGAVAATAALAPAATVWLLHGVAIAGAGLAWAQARTARRTAEKVSSDLDIVATRLIQLDHRIRQPSGTSDPALRSSVAEVTGEIGLLGGILRDLAETVAAQDRDVADLKARMAPLVQSRRPAPEDPPRRPTTPQPEPCLLPHTSRGAAPDRITSEPVIPQADIRPAAAIGGPAPEPSRAREAVPVRVESPGEREPVGREVAIPDGDARRLAAIVQAFEADWIEIHLQPIVALPQRKIRFYEALARLRLADGGILVPAEFLPHLERLGHAPEFDRRVLGRAITIARHLMARGSEAIVSMNLSPRALEEPGFLRSLNRIVEGAPDTLGRIVFELSQRCWRTLDAERAGALATLRDKGVPLAMDRATDLRLDPLALADRGVRFVKLPADLMIAADRSRGLDIEMADLASVLRRAGIRLVADRVEAEEMVPDLIDLDVPLAQGFVFSAPRAVRSEVLGASARTDTAAKPVAEPDPDPPAPPSPPQRLPYRSFLRRAG